MATTYKTNLVNKKMPQRGVAGGKLQSVTGILHLVDGAAIGTSDLILAVPMGENTRPVRIILQAVNTSGTTALTNAVFDVGVITIKSTSFKRPDGTEYPAIPTDASVLSAGADISTDFMATDIEIPPPVADTISKYAPYYITLTPTGAFSTAGGDCDLCATIEFAGEQVSSTLYSSYYNVGGV